MAILDFYGVGVNKVFNDKFNGYAYLCFDTSTFFTSYMEWKKGVDGDVVKSGETNWTRTECLLAVVTGECEIATLYYWRMCIRVSGVTYYTDWSPVTTNTYETFVFRLTDPSYKLQTLKAESTNYSTAHNAASGSMIETNQVGQQKWSTTYRIFRSPGLFNTTGIIPSRIISAVFCGSYLGPLIANIKIVVQSGQPDFPHDPVVGADYNKANYGVIGGESETLVAGKRGYSIRIPLGEGFFNWIQNGITKLMFRSSKEMVASPPIGSDEHVKFYPAELLIEYLPLPPLTVNNIGAENNRVFARTVLTGEISDISGTIVERGFEYKIQDAEPGAGDTGTEVKETKAAGFDDGEYSLRNQELYDQQYIADDIVWWFRAYCKDDEANKTTAETWMKNLPNVLTQDMTNINYNKADGNGLIVSEGASELTMRGFAVTHEFSDRLPNSWKFEIAGFEGELEAKTTENDIGVIIDFYWAGELIKTVLETAGLEIGAYVITIGEMVWGWPLADDCLIEGKAYKCRAFAENEFGRVYGDEVDFTTWARTYFSEDPPTVGEITIIKNENIENLPEGITASRRGFRYGTSEAADEFDVHEDGSFTNGPYSMMLSDLLPDTTYYIYAYIVVNGIVYEGNLETLTTDPEGTEDEDEYPTPHFSPHGQDYREISTKVSAEVLASQGIIDFSGGKKTLPIVNHLIQTNPDAKTIADSYLDRFKLAKTRMTVTFPTPLPFEREDTVDFSFGKLLFKEDGQGISHFKEDGEGSAVLMDQITMMIKKINSVGLTKTPESIEYVAELDLEHERVT